MNSEVKKYFINQYRQAGFVIVPGHWPDFENKKQVDDWIDKMNTIKNCIITKCKIDRFKYVDDPDDF